MKSLRYVSKIIYTRENRNVKCVTTSYHQTKTKVILLLKLYNLCVRILYSFLYVRLHIHVIYSGIASIVFKNNKNSESLHH